MYPSLVINSKTYRGQIDPVSAFNAVCASFQDPPRSCWRTLGKQSEPLPPVMDLIEETIVTVGEIVTLILAFVLANVFVLYCCRRR